ncbi:hypothetical protein D9757_005923 [Collybiopsis confluens]|uniref:Uncharacterized protein n=1 Tax=Collybiopsis confluens TaxID=2823264 RepID=A0A8H5HN54_9AGAR|nr:hypothetical protein D9757_005923 [Collybiopsis confluens]
MIPPNFNSLSAAQESTFAPRFYLFISSFIKAEFAECHRRKVSHSRKLVLSIVAIMFVNHTGLVTAASICYSNDLKSLYETVEQGSNYQAQLVEVVLARINVSSADPGTMNTMLTTN